MNLNKIGVFGGMLAFISLFLPWWEMSMRIWWRIGSSGMATSANISVFPYQITATEYSLSQTIAIDSILFVLFVMPIFIFGNMLGIASSIVFSNERRELLVCSGGLILLSVVIFTISLQGELLVTPPAPYFFVPFDAKLVPIPRVGMFSSGDFAHEGVSMSYSTYLSTGFWLAVVAAIIMFVSAKKSLEVTT